MSSSTRRGDRGRSRRRSRVLTRLALELRRSKRAAVVVVLGIAVAVLSGVVLMRQLTGGSPFADTRTVQVAVTDAKSVVPGKNEVRWSGVVVGRITRVRLDDGRPVLEAKIDNGLAPELYRDARLRLRPQTALNDMYLDVVSRGTPAAGPLDGDRVLHADRTRTAVDVAEVLNVFSTSTRDRVQQTLDELSVGLPDRGELLRSTFAQLVPFALATGKLSRAIADRDTATRQLVRRLRLITDETATRADAITGLVQNAGATFAALGERRVALDRTLQELPRTLEQMRGSFTRLRGTLAVTRPALRALQPTAKALPEGLQALRRVAAEAEPTLVALDPAVDALRPLARDLVPTASSLARAFATLTPQLGRVDRVTAGVSRCELSLQKFFALTMSTLKFGNRSNLTSSPRGLLVPTSDDATNGGGNLVASTGCADGRPAP